MGKMNRARGATIGLLVPAVMALGISANTSYRYMGRVLEITDHTERLLLCGVAEAAIVALTLYAWATRTKGPAYLAYAAVLVQGVPAFQISPGSGGMVRVVLGPVLLAAVLHLLLGLELRMTQGRSDGLFATAAREVRERLVAYLGIGRRGADSAAIARSRAADRAVDLADKVAEAAPGTRKHGRRTAALAAAIDSARHGLDGQEADAAEAAIVARVVRRKSVASLATIDVTHDWTQSLALSPRSERREEPGESPESIESEEREDTADVTMFAASLLAHEPPPWRSLSLRQAVAKADEITPGLDAGTLSRVLAEVGIDTSAGSVRSTRSALRRDGARES